MLKSFLAVIGAAVLLTACSDDPVSTPAADSYLATKSGSYYIQDNTIVTGSPAAPRDSTTTRDSVVFTGQKTVEGKTASEFVMFGSDGVAKDTTYFAQDGKKIYILFNMEYEVGATPINLGKRWVIVADADATTWTALKDTVPTLSVSYSGFPLTAKAGILFTGAKGATETLTINGSAVSAIKYTLTSSTMVYIDNPIPPNTPIIVPVNTSIDYWFAKNIGLVKASQAPFNVSFSAMGSPVNVDIPGSRSTTVRFKVD